MQWGRNQMSIGSMVERAKEDLELLESQHPNRFHYLKLDLKTFISEHLPLINTDISPSKNCNPSSSLTRESSNRKKRKKFGAHVFAGGQEVEAESDDGCSIFMKKRRCKTDAVLERAHQCLHKIQEFKTSFY